MLYIFQSLIITIVIIIFYDRQKSKKNDTFNNTEQCDEHKNWADCFEKSNYKCIWSNMDVATGDYCKPLTCNFAENDIQCDQLNQRGFNCIWDTNLETPKCKNSSELTNL